VPSLSIDALLNDPATREKMERIKRQHSHPARSPEAQPATTITKAGGNLLNKESLPPLLRDPAILGAAIPEWPDIGKRGQPLATCTNARKAIEALGIECRYDLFHDRHVVGGHAIEQWAGELSDHACQMLRVIIKETFGFDPGKENTHDAAIQLCLLHQFDPVGDYLDRLRWDKRPRLDTAISAAGHRNPMRRC
jgi:hypothetical protein